MKKSYIQNVCRNIKEKTQTDEREEATTFHSQQEMMVMVIMKMNKI